MIIDKVHKKIVILQRIRNWATIIRLANHELIDLRSCSQVQNQNFSNPFRPSQSSPCSLFPGSNKLWTFNFPFSLSKLVYLCNRSLCRKVFNNFHSVEIAWVYWSTALMTSSRKNPWWTLSIRFDENFLRTQRCFKVELLYLVTLCI